jgi:hypothetical protein
MEINNLLPIQQPLTLLQGSSYTQQLPIVNPLGIQSYINHRDTNWIEIGNLINQLNLGINLDTFKDFLIDVKQKLSKLEYGNFNLLVNKLLNVNYNLSASILNTKKLLIELFKHITNFKNISSSTLTQFDIKSSNDNLKKIINLEIDNANIDTTTKMTNIIYNVYNAILSNINIIQVLFAVIIINSLLKNNYKNDTVNSAISSFIDYVIQNNSNTELLYFCGYIRDNFTFLQSKIFNYTLFYHDLIDFLKLYENQLGGIGSDLYRACEDRMRLQIDTNRYNRLIKD